LAANVYINQQIDATIGTATARGLPARAGIRTLSDAEIKSIVDSIIASPLGLTVAKYLGVR
jgi:hypothetical protein